MVDHDRGTSPFGPTPLATVVVMTFNRPDGLHRCLTSLSRQTLDPAVFDVVVVDVSTPPVDAVLETFLERLRILHHPAPNLGVAANRNLGAHLARGEVLAFLDDDCVAGPTWLAELVAAVQHDPRTLAGGPVIHPRPESATAAAGQVITEVVEEFFHPPGASPRFLPGLNFALRRERFLAIGGCDPGFGFLAAEDRDFVDRWITAGGRLVLCTAAQVRHEHRSSLGSFLRQYFNYGRGAWRYHRLRRQRCQGNLWIDAQLHTALPFRLKEPLRRLAPRLRLQVLLLIGGWQIANLTGFLWQAADEHRPGRGRDTPGQNPSGVAGEQQSQPRGGGSLRTALRSRRR